MNRRIESRRAADRKRRKNLPWRKWYFTPAWRIRRAQQLDRVPWCEPCKAMGKTRKATDVNHKEPHRGDREKFFKGPLESCCAGCHSGFVQRSELKGFRAVIDEEGWPTDPSHPFNKARTRQPSSKR